MLELKYWNKYEKTHKYVWQKEIFMVVVFLLVLKSGTAKLLAWQMGGDGTRW